MTDRHMTEHEAIDYADTLAGRMEDLTRRAHRIGAHGLIADLDQLNARLRDERNRILEADHD